MTERMLGNRGNIHEALARFSRKFKLGRYASEDISLIADHFQELNVDTIKSLSPDELEFVFLSR